MALADALLPEFDHETGLTRRLLERLPDGRADWKPHARSMSLGRLSAHVCEVLAWLPRAVTTTEYNWDSTQPYEPRVCETRADTVAFFDEAQKAARAALAGVSDGELMQPWTFKKDGQTVFSMPRVGIVRGMVLNHLIHHRGQLSVYLRLNDVPLPGMYGPSADEGF
jgi:uncharacterized damage-inducible protein DinB